MDESFNQSEGVPITAESVAELMDSLGPEDAKVHEAMGLYVEQCQSWADREIIASGGGCEATNRITLMAAIRMAYPYVSSKKFQGHALQDLQEILDAAKQNPSTLDLVGEAEAMLADIGKESH